MFDDLVPPTWSVNAKWLKTRQESFQKFMRALFKGMNLRRDNPYQNFLDIEEVTYGDLKSHQLSPDVAIWLGAEEQISLLESGQAYRYVQNIKNFSSNNNISNSVTIDEIIDFSYLEKACKDLI